MRAGLMEGLIGANNNMQLTDTTMSVYRRGKALNDEGMMASAMEKTGEITQKANEYNEQAKEELKEEIKETREESEKIIAENIENRKLKKEDQANKLDENLVKDIEAKSLEEGKEVEDSKDVNKEADTEITQNNHGDTLAISGEGKQLSQTLNKENTGIVVVKSSISSTIDIGQSKV